MSQSELISCRSIAFSSKISIDDIVGSCGTGSKEQIEEKSFRFREGDRKLVFAFRYRAVVFIGFSEQEFRNRIEPLLKKLGSSKGYKEEDHYQIECGSSKLAVGFNSLSLPTWDEKIVTVLAQVLARSDALGIVESETDELIRGSQEMTNAFFSWITMFPRRRSALLHLQEVLRIRHRLILQLSLLKEPQIVWNNEQIDRVYGQLIENFDFRDRIEGVERILELSSEVGHLQLENIHARRAELLEMVIILLILVEVVHAFAK